MVKSVIWASKIPLVLLRCIFPVMLEDDGVKDKVFNSVCIFNPVELLLRILQPSFRTASIFFNFIPPPFFSQINSSTVMIIPFFSFFRHLA